MDIGTPNESVMDFNTPGGIPTLPTTIQACSKPDQPQQPLRHPFMDTPRSHKNVLGEDIMYETPQQFDCPSMERPIKDQ